MCRLPRSIRAVSSSSARSARLRGLLGVDEGRRRRRVVDRLRVDLAVIRLVGVDQVLVAVVGIDVLDLVAATEHRQLLSGMARP
jgi:hypothetical protein